MRVSVLILSIFGLLSTITAFDASQILKADLTCCRQHTDSQYGCEHESGSNCVWLDANDPIALKYGQCIGQALYNCKLNDGIGACCGVCQPTPDPARPPSQWPTYAPIAGPLCGPSPTVATPAPTPEPSREHCSLCEYDEVSTSDENCYYFEGYPCIISGEPHTKLFNGAAHDFQGQPSKIVNNGHIKNQFYYITNCADSDTEDMPFSVLATHYQMPKTIVAGVDYIVIELYESTNSVYFVYLSSSIHSYAKKAGVVTTNYDNTALFSGLLTSLVSGNATNIGTRFKLHFVRNSALQIEATLIIDNEFVVKIFMEAQGMFRDNRYRIHYTQIDQSAEYKCFSCGLCGTFKDVKTRGETQLLETCDGNYVEYNRGESINSASEAYDPDGWSWEYYYRHETCSSYDITDNNGDDFQYIPSCDESIEALVVAECQTARDTQDVCCEEIIGGVFCDELQDDCNYDACVMAGGNTTKIPSAVDEVFTSTIEYVCAIPDVGEDFDTKRLNVRTARPTNTQRPTNTPRPTRPKTQNPTNVRTLRPTTQRPTNTKRPTNTPHPTAPRSPHPTNARTARPTNTPRPTRTVVGEEDEEVVVVNEELMKSEQYVKSSVYLDYMQLVIILIVGLLILLVVFVMRCRTNADDKYTPIDDPKPKIQI